MVGFYDVAPPDSTTLRQMGTDVIPSTAGEVFGSSFGEGLAENLTPRMMRAQGRFTATTGIMGVDDFGRPIQGEPEPLIDTEAANSQYGIKGHLSFDQPVPQSVAKDLFEHKRAQLDREDTIARREGGLLTGGAARFTAALAAGTLDPLNVAVGFIPVIGPAREALLLEQAATAAGRAALRAGIGAASGAVGMAALQPFEFGLSKQEHEDYTMAMALRSVALGTVLGGGLHAGIGAVVDRATGKYLNPLTQRLEEVGPEVRETLLQGALAQHLEERPVEVASALDAMESAAAARLRRIDELTNDRLAAERGDLANGSPVRSFSAIEADERAATDVKVADQGPEDLLVRQTEATAAAEVPSAPLNYRGNKPVSWVVVDKATGKPVLETFEEKTAAAINTAKYDVVPIDDYLSNLSRTTRALNTQRGPEFGAAAPDPNQKFTEAVTDLTSAARRVPDISDTMLASREAAKAPNDELQTIENHNAELEARRSPAGAENAAEPGAVDPVMELAEARARAYERAGACLTRGG